MSLRRWLILTLVGGQLIGVTFVGAISRPSDPAPTIAFMQLALHILGYDPGLIDGLQGPRTVAALTAYAQDRRIVLNQATVELVVTLLAAEASEALHHIESTREPPQVRGLRMLPVYQW